MAEEDSLLERSLSGIGIVFSVTGFRIIANLAMQMILTRLLAPEAFGIVAFATTVVGFCALLTNVQGQKAIIRCDHTQAPAFTDAAFTIELFLSLVISLLLICSAPAVLRALDKPEVIPFVRVLAFTLVGERLLTPKAWFERQLDFLHANIPGLVGIIANATVSVSLGFLGAGPWSIVGGILAKSITQLAVLWSIASYRPRLCWDPQTVTEILRFGFPLTGAAIVAYFYWNVDDFLVGKIAGNEKLGYYWLAFKFPHYILAAQTALNSVIFPAFSRARDDTQLLRGFNLATRTSAFGLLPFCSIALTLGEPTIRYFFGPKWLPAAFAFQVFMVLITMRGIVAHWTQVMTCKGETAFQFRVIVLNAIVLLLLGYPLLLHYDFNGMAVAVLLTIVFSFVFMVPKLKSLLPISYRTLLARPLLAFVLTSGVMALLIRHPGELSLWQYMAAVVAQGALYLLLLYLLDRAALLEIISIFKSYAFQFHHTS
jgi:O-antigen/teichoic acid export membrane protein